MCYVFQNDQVPKGCVTVVGTLGRNYTVITTMIRCSQKAGSWGCEIK